MLFNEYPSRRPRLLGEDIFSTPRSIQRIFDSFLQDVLQQPQQILGQNISAFSPMVDVEENDKEVRIVAELPGLKEEDVEIVYERGAIVLRGEKREEERREAQRGRGRYEEIRYGAFERRIPLSSEVEEEQIQASFDRGVLMITVPKSEEARQQAKRIPIRSGAATQQLEHRQSQQSQQQQQGASSTRSGRSQQSSSGEARPSH